MDPGDSIAIQAVINLYGFLIDEQRWDELGAVFTDDAVLEVASRDWVMRGVVAIADGYSSARHPLGHHMTNTVIADGPSPDQATAITKYLTVRADGSAGTGRYEDRFVRTADGWRIAARVAVHRGELPPGGGPNAGAPRP